MKVSQSKASADPTLPTHLFFGHRLNPIGVEQNIEFPYIETLLRLQTKALARLRKQTGQTGNMSMQNRIKLLVLAVTCVLGMAATAMAQNFPSRPITIVVPFAAGGPTDTVAQIVAEHMRTSLVNL